MIKLRFGKWTVIGTADASKDRQKRLMCRCECGNERPVQVRSLLNGRSSKCKSCSNGQNSYLHGEAGKDPTAIYVIWKSMKARCLNPNHINFRNYGGRGIAICREWIDSYAAFRAHVGPRPTPSHTLDRRDNNGNYEPGNVAWATPAEQARNRRPRRASVSV